MDKMFRAGVRHQHIEDDIRKGEFQMDYELPEDILDDPRLGKSAIANDGCTGNVESISRFSDGYELISIYNEQTGIGCHGETSSFTISE